MRKLQLRMPAQSVRQGQEPTEQARQKTRRQDPVVDIPENF